MGDPAMTLGPEELQKIGDYVRLHLPDWMQGMPAAGRNNDIIERAVRVEEELKAQRELMQVRFESLQELMETRFEAMNRRFESLQELMETRFEAVDRRFEVVDKHFNSLQWTMGLGFTLIAALMGIFNFF
ncbi:hypothetical protein B4O97_10895 [Marispirochaeta aestuarii]|uniref:DUF1640 domain-containing protein n=1 Tax=Marispirochaeta aestuarii TaxID=1963862 RepID=A0A1Y1RX14_9SPIO|nr:hypothetical protein [Marispirochaeta aestuarii]ORC34837.1 hypothetical protein B4O97_10895 [Marispirochaeta aestuarii]